MEENNQFLDTEKEEQLRKTFLEKLGIRIRDIREKKNIPQTVLAKGIGVNGPTLSKYENGEADMKVSNLSMISLYCNIPVKSIIPSDDVQAFIDTFKEAVSIKQKRYERANKRKITSSRKMIGRVYEENNQSYIEHIMPTYNEVVSKKERILRGDYDVLVEPLTDIEVYDFIVEYNKKGIAAIESAGEMLKHLSNDTKKETIKGHLSDFIVNEILFGYPEEIKQDLRYKRLLAYYRLLIGE